ncbi:ABC transporter ATP-binding protein [Rubrimonas cliftonensis]|uniref:ABC transporter ATP-binding protein n=1 Tax=Rubrimonas cliftonensis TaxID=89524 RepID=UPI001FE12A24|nr:ATP-binding cassette domain-containing protein [Rubrimonas cliftonensis]
MTAPALSARDVTVTAADGRLLLRLDRLDVAPGAALGVRGPSGAGKSTLLNALAGLLRPATGAIRWGGTDVAALGEAARDAFRRRFMGLIFQDFLLFEELSPLDNAAVGAAFAPRAERAAIRARAAALLDRLGVAAGARDVSRMSGGERQRIAVARALSGGPRVILADEPTASLDRANADLLIADLLALAREGGGTVIAVSHDPAVTMAMDRIVSVVDGVARDGDHAGAAVVAAPVAERARA